MDEWFESIRLPITIEEFRRLPTNPAYKYEYFNNHALLTPRPRAYQAVRDLVSADPPAVDPWGEHPLRRLRDDDWDRLPNLFAEAFWRVLPYAMLDDTRRLEAARKCITKTRTGGDGPIIPEACWIAATEDDDQPVAAALTTLQPRIDEEDEPLDDDPDDPPPVPHLTWIFVPPLLARHGVGTALLANVSRALVDLGHDRLDSTFLLGNESSTLWHWRNGFRLRGYGIIPRRRRRRRAKTQADLDLSKAPDPPC